MSSRGFELLVYVGLEGISVTRYIGDGGIDAQGDLIAGRFRIPVGIQVNRYRSNMQRPDIDRLIGALSGRFAEGMFMTTANYTLGALQKTATSIPRVLPLNGDQVASIYEVIDVLKSADEQIEYYASLYKGNKSSSPEYFCVILLFKHLVQSIHFLIEK